jgi:hypothetical protein
LIDGKATFQPGKPSRRYYHSGTLVEDHIFYFGGKDFNVRINELVDYTIPTHTAKTITASNQPSPRGSHSCIYYCGAGSTFKNTNKETSGYSCEGRGLYVYGGSDAIGGNVNVYDDFYRYDIGFFL